MNDTTKTGAFVNIKGHRCKRCGHTWRPRRLNEEPPTCPHCKSAYWNRERETTK